MKSTISFVDEERRDNVWLVHEKCTSHVDWHLHSTSRACGRGLQISRQVSQNGSVSSKS